MRRSILLLLFPVLLLGIFAFAFAATSVSFQNTSRINVGLLTAAISASPTHVKVGHAVSFVCTATGGVSPFTYSWNFGDGTTGTGSALTHAYSSIGTKIVTCTITDFILSIATNQTTIIVS